MNNLVGVFGAGGFGREVMPLVSEQFPFASSLEEATRIVFVDDDLACSDEVNGFQLMSFDDFCNESALSKSIAISAGGVSSRKSIYKRVVESGVSLLSVQASNAIQLQSVQIGAGSILCPFTTITSNVKIGKCFHANLYSYVAHDCIIGDFVTFAPGVKCNGNVIIEDDVYVGTGAIIKQGNEKRPIVIGNGSKIEAGAYVTKSVGAGETVFGNPSVKLSLSSLRRLKSAN